MRTALLVFSLLTFAFSAAAQQHPQRRITLKNLGNDSLHIPFNDQYFLIEDSCAQITRQVNFNAKQGFYYGAFKDIAAQNPDMIVAEGSYNSVGFIDGGFAAYYPNGNPKAKGSFNAGELDGEWQLFYPSGSPKLTFTAKGNSITLQEAWDSDSTKVVNNGNGTYQLHLNLITWKGKLLNGKPTGTWIAVAPHDRSNRVIASERFKKGVFVSGTSPIGKYTDASRINWADMSDFPILNAEKMAVSTQLCDATPHKLKIIVGANYRSGLNAYSDEIKRICSEYLSKIDLRPYDDELHIEGEVSEDGRLINLRHKKAFNDRIATRLAGLLGRLPLLEPALLDGKPIRQKFLISFRFYEGMYSFDYRFLPIRLDENPM